MKKSAATLFALILLIAPLSAFAAPEIIKVRYWAGPEHTRIVIDTSGDASIKVDKSQKRVSILFKGFVLSNEIPAEKTVDQPGLEKIISRVDQGDARIDLILTEGVEAAVFKLQKIQDKPDRVVIDLTVPELEKKESERRQQIKAKFTEKDKIVIIDPGHGGEDPGAIGRRRTREKDVVLQIAKRLEADLNGREGYKAFLTRNADYYPSFKKRLQIAWEYGADIFVSIHADAARNRSARGGSVYCLSTSGASSEAAKILARNENLADIVGGTDAGESASTEESDVIMLNMVQTETINMSKTLGSIVLSNLSDVNRLKFKRIQEAPFRVLKMPHIPSVLVETAYISNPVEEQLLKDPAFQKKVSHAVAEAIVDFLSSDENGTRPAVMAAINPVKSIAPARAGKAEETIASQGEPAAPEEEAEEPEAPRAVKKGGKPPAEPDRPQAASPRKKPRGAFITYTVKKGDSLDRIARRNNTTVSEIVRANNMSARGPLYVNKRLKIPTGEIPLADEKVSRKKEKLPERFHKVKRGDNLDKIAIRYGTSISALLKLNDMKIKDPLVIGRRLKVSGEVPSARAEAATATRGEKPGAKTARKKAGEEEEVSQTRAARKKEKPKEKPADTYYVVRRGDTLEKIALRNNTTIPALMKLNNMKKGGTLLAGRRIRLAAEPAPETETPDTKA